MSTPVSANVLIPNIENNIEADTKWPPFYKRYFKSIFVYENCFIFIDVSLKFVRKAPIKNNLSLVEIVAWHRTGDKWISEPMMA